MRSQIGCLQAQCLARLIPIARSKVLASLPFLLAMTTCPRTVIEYSTSLAPSRIIERDGR